MTDPTAAPEQHRTENADLEREKRELAATPELELRELQAIYVDRGLGGSSQ
jgi:hypothetical protein